jgi:tetratricopeptide (TPR) repeat protein
MTEEEYALYQKVVTMLAANPDFALKLLEAMFAEREQPSPAFQFIMGNAYYAAGMNDKAEASYRTAVERYPTFLRAWVNLGILYYSGGHYGDAVPCFSRAVELGDRDSSTFGLLGYSLQKEGDLVSAEMAYMQALSGDPGSVDWKEGLLEICIDGKQYTRGESLVRNLIKERPTDGRYWLDYGNILVAEGRKVEATVVLETCAGAGYANAEDLSMLGDLYAEEGLVPEAAGVYEKILQVAPEIGEHKLIHYAEVLIELGKLPDAAVALGRIKPAEDGSFDVDVLQTKSDLLAAEQKWPEVIQELDTLLRAAPFNGRALLSLGRAYLAQNDVARATIAFETAYKAPASTYVASLELANIEIKNRHYAKSADYLQKALSIQKTDEVEDYLIRVRSLIPKDG